MNHFQKTKLLVRLKTALKQRNFFAAGSHSAVNRFVRQPALLAAVAVQNRNASQQGFWVAVPDRGQRRLAFW